MPTRSLVAGFALLELDDKVGDYAAQALLQYLLANLIGSAE